MKNIIILYRRFYLWLFYDSIRPTYFYSGSLFSILIFFFMMVAGFGLLIYSGVRLGLGLRELGK